MSSLKGKVAIVTGGGRGIGRSHALALAAAGAAVVVNDLGGEFTGAGAPSSEPAESVAAEIVAAGGQAIADGRDVGDWNAARAIVDGAIERFGRLDILVNNAAVARGKGVKDLEEIDWTHSLAVNLGGPVALTHWAAVHWQKQGPEAGRSIINTASPVVVPPIPDGLPYVTSKAAIVAVTMATALELADLGVRVNAIAPVARTRISVVMAPDVMKPVDQGFDRMAPENVSALVVYLASPSNRLTARFLGVVGDQLIVYDGFTAAQSFGNDDKRWSPEELDAAFAQVPRQQQVGSLTGRGRMERPYPPDLTLETLDGIAGS